MSLDIAHAHSSAPRASWQSRLQRQHNDGLIVCVEGGVLVRTTRSSQDNWQHCDSFQAQRLTHTAARPIPFDVPTHASFKITGKAFI